MPTNFQAQFFHGDPLMVDHTPVGAVAAGDVVVVASEPRIAHRAIAAGRKGALAAGGGVYLCDCNAAIADGDTVWWDDTNNRVTETATSNTHFGIAVGASFTSNTLVYVKHQPQGVVGAIV